MLKKMTSLLSISIFLSSTLCMAAAQKRIADPNAINVQKAAFCKKAAQEPEFFQKRISESANQLAFTNHGGIGSGGVCWWHSRFTRNATYLAIFRPELPRPSDAEVDAILSAIKNADGMVEIPGFRNLQEFSYVHYKKIQSLLESWQISNGIFGFAWLSGNLGGNEEADPETVERVMGNLYQRVHEKKQVTFEYLQMPGVTAHAWLVTGMEKFGEGYLLTVVDSNMFGTRSYIYRKGEKQIIYVNGSPLTPWIGNTDELASLISTVEEACGIQMPWAHEDSQAQANNTAARDH